MNKETTALFRNLEPVKVHPLIKLGRYVALGLGIFYGMSKQKVYESLEEKEQAHEKELQEVRYNKIKEEKAIRNQVYEVSKYEEKESDVSEQVSNFEAKPADNSELVSKMNEEQTDVSELVSKMNEEHSDQVFDIDADYTVEFRYNYE